MTVLRSTLVVGAALYVGLWVLEIHGATMLLPLLLVPTILILLVAGGNFLSHYLGLPARRERFTDRDRDRDRDRDS